MAVIISQQTIEYDKKLKHYKETSIEAKNLVQIIEKYFQGLDSRSQLNKAVKKVKYLTMKEIL